MAIATERVQSLQQRARAHRGLLREILRGLNPLELGSAAEMATALGVNRTAVREALAILASQGFVIQEPQRGFRVVPVSEDDVREMMRLRLASEVDVVRTLARSGSWDSREVQAARQEMISLHAGLGQSSDQLADARVATSRDDLVNGLLEFGDADNRFHVALARAARFSTAARYIDTWRDFLRLYRAQTDRLNNGPADREAILAEHQEVVTRIGRNDEDGARQAIEAHITNAMMRASLERMDLSATTSALAATAAGPAAGTHSH